MFKRRIRWDGECANNKRTESLCWVIPGLLTDTLRIRYRRRCRTGIPFELPGALCVEYCGVLGWDRRQYPGCYKLVRTRRRCKRLKCERGRLTKSQLLCQLDLNLACPYNALCWPGECSSAWLEHRSVEPGVVGSSPITHPKQPPSLGGIFK